MQEQQIQAKQQEAQMKMQFEASENDKDRQAAILQAQIKSAGYASTQDINQNMQSDYVDAMDKLENTDLYRRNTDLQETRDNNQQVNATNKLSLEKEKLQTQKDIAMTKLQIARENKNRYDLEAEE